MSGRRFEGRVALVSGAARGIGRAIAVELAREGASVVVNDILGREQAAGAMEEIAALGAGAGRAHFVQADVSDRAAVDALVNEAVGTFGRLDFLVNNAAWSVRKPLLDLDPADVERTWAVTLWGVFHLSQLAARAMVTCGNGGAILTVSSVHGWRPYPNASAYNGAKAAVTQMALTWAVELAPHGIRVNVLEPGWTDTPGERAFKSGEQLAEAGRGLLLGRLSGAGEMARVAAFLLSDEAAYVTGSVLRADGGYAITH
jgi:glucose 1-dehydrogenase